MSPFQLGAALALLAGALVAVSARDPRWILGGLVVCVGLAAVVADPLPSILAVAIRLVAAVLGADLVLLAVRAAPAPTQAAPLGPLSVALAGAAAAVVGYASSGLGSPAAGPALATAAGLGLATIAVGPLLLGRDIIRIGAGMALLATAAELVRAGLAGTPGPLEQAVIGLVTAGILGVTAAVVASALRAGDGLAVTGGTVRETLFEAHPVAAPRRASSDREVRPRTAGRGPAARPRRDAAAHQLTLEERLRRAGPAGEPVPAVGLAKEPGPAEEPAAAAGPPAPADPE